MKYRGAALTTGRFPKIERAHCSPGIQVHTLDEYDRWSRVGTAVDEQDKDDVQRWMTKCKAVLVLSIVKAETRIQEAADIMD